LPVHRRNAATPNRSKQAQQSSGGPIACLLADAGYPSEENFLALEERKIEGIVALQRESKAVKQEKKKNNEAAGEASERRARRRPAAFRSIHPPCSYNQRFGKVRYRY